MVKWIQIQGGWWIDIDKAYSLFIRNHKIKPHESGEFEYAVVAEFPFAVTVGENDTASEKITIKTFKDSEEAHKFMDNLVSVESTFSFGDK